MLIEKELKNLSYIMLYGEGWNMATEVPPRYRANMQNHFDGKVFNKMF